MNYLLELDEYSAKNFYYQKSHRINYTAFRKFFCIRRNTYFDIVLYRLYRELFCNGECLYREYKKYYKKEFETFELFLKRKYNFLSSDFENYSCIKRIVYKHFSYSSDSVVNTLCDEGFNKKLCSFMEKIYEI